jgi:hypothetical protein
MSVPGLFSSLAEMGTFSSITCCHWGALERSHPQTLPGPPTTQRIHFTTWDCCSFSFSLCILPRLHQVNQNSTRWDEMANDLAVWSRLNCSESSHALNYVTSEQCHGWKSTECKTCSISQIRKEKLKEILKIYPRLPLTSSCDWWYM